MKRFFLDTEFMESGPAYPIYLLSIGVVDADGHSFYAVSRDAPLVEANPWVREHVLPHLDLAGAVPLHAIAAGLVNFLGCGPFEVWTYYGAYDWVVFCQIFGAMSALPDGWPMYTHDLRAWLDEHGHADIHQPDDAPHHALSDAQWIADTHARYVEAQK